MSWNESKSAVFYLAIEHDDWCLYWTTDDPASCNCSPTVRETAVNDDNIQEVSELIADDNRRANKLRQGRRS